VAAVAGELQDVAGREVETRTSKAPARATRHPSLALKFLVLKRDGFRCVACGRSPATEAGLVLEVDHMLAWSNGGNTVAQNLQTLCRDCNRGKSAT
jgi:5-methylcytosine-specific restriction endonuclease McrA